ncbi:MAG TPA: PQQ-binding-like beta-propeller repeat protein [Pyrinomonadaceae bacterium]|nr:PQQ-binding-like beta-propeller repeat protein [Pyrinomonadaceae bacterium]
MKHKLVLIRLSIALLLSQAVFVAGQSSVAVADQTKASKEVSLSEPLTIGWRYDTPATLNLTPAFDDERVYLPLAEGVVVSLQGATGQLNWRAEMGGELSASPVADNHMVYVASATGKPEAGVRRATGALRALGREAGVTQWMRTFEMPLRGALTLANGKLFAASSNGRVYSFDSKTGTVLWFYDYGKPFNAQPVVSDSRVYVGSEDGTLLAFDETNGKLLWFYKTKGAVGGPVANGDDQVYFGSDDGYVYAVAVSTGRLKWRSRLGAGVQAVAKVGDDLLVASLDNFVYKFSSAGRRLWKRQMPGRISSQPLMGRAEALFTPLSGSAGVVLELRDGKQVNTLPVGEEISNSASPIAVANAILLTTETGLLAFMRPKRQ